MIDGARAHLPYKENNFIPLKGNYDLICLDVLNNMHLIASDELSLEQVPQVYSFYTKEFIIKINKQVNSNHYIVLSSSCNGQMK